MIKLAPFLLLVSLGAHADWAQITDFNEQVTTLQKIMDLLPDVRPSHCFFQKDTNDMYVEIFSGAYDTAIDAEDAEWDDKTVKLEARQYGPGYIYQNTDTQQITVMGDDKDWNDSKARMTVTFDAQMASITQVHFEVNYDQRASVDCPLQ